MRRRPSLRVYTVNSRWGWGAQEATHLLRLVAGTFRVVGNGGTFSSVINNVL